MVIEIRSNSKTGGGMVVMCGDAGVCGVNGGGGVSGQN